MVEHRQGWKLGVSPGHFITLGIALMAAAVAWGAGQSEIQSNTKAIEVIIALQSQDRAEAKRDRQIIKEELRSDMNDIKGDVKQILNYMLNKK